MNATLSNILSNAIARLWSIVIGIVLIPVYTNIIGMEAYGLVGFYGTLVGSLAILDLGLSSTLSRELARAQALSTPSKNIRNLVFSLECIYWSMGVILGLLVILLAPIIATHWVKAEKLPINTIQNAVIVMGGIIAFQWPQSIYSGGLMGMQKQVSFNIANIILSTVKNIGVIFVLKWLSPTVTTFFVWQIFISFLTVIILRKLLWHYLPKHIDKTTFSKEELKKIWKFAAGMTGISLATFCLAQIDKIVLSRLLPLEDYGYYTLSWTVGTSILMAVSVLGNTLLPKMAEVVARGNKNEIITSFHKYNKLIASAITPLGLFLVFFSKEIISIWTQNPVTTDNIWLAVSILTLGSVCNSFMHISYYLLLGYGDTRYPIYQNIIASIILTPLLFWWTDLWGLTGASLVWFSVNFGYTIISLPIVHRYLPILNGELKKTYLQDMFLPILISISLLSAAKICFFNNWLIIIQLFYFVILMGVMYMFIILTNREYKYILISFLQKIWR